MSKKKFKDGLESLFAEIEQNAMSEQNALLEASGSERRPASSRESNPAAEKRSTGKKFADDMESFLQSAFEESFDRQMRQEQLSPAEEAQIRKRSHRPVSGLDALIRSTVQPQEVHLEEHPKRRLTIVFDDQKLQKLREIARLEKTYLKNIIDEIVAEYIQTYEKKKKKG